MKGRRRARQLALQALYELDQSDHPVERVLAHRVDAFLAAAGRALLSEAEQALQLRMLSQLDLQAEPLSPGARIDIEAMALELAVEASLLTKILGKQGDYEPQSDYAVAIVRGVLLNRAQIDAVIARIAPEWPVDQMAPIDRNTLRIALWEIGGGEVPLRVAINEAVELARKFSGEGARRMVNGALGAFTAEGMQLTIDAAS